MRILKLTMTDGFSVVYVNPAEVITMQPRENGGTVLQMRESIIVRVIESPDKIAEKAGYVYR